jgi:hypothetical protein
MMKRFLLLAICTALTIFFATPAVLGIVDSWCYVVLGRTVTGVDWSGGNAMVAWAMLIPMIGCVFVGGFIAEEQR